MKIGKEIALKIKKQKINICDEWISNMNTFSNYSQLATMYFKGSDWSMENDFPNLEILRKHRGALLPYGMMTDVKESIFNKRYLAVFGDSNVKLKYTGFAVGELIIRHKSIANIEVIDNAYLVINILDEAMVKIDCKDDAKVIVYNYCSSKIESTGNVIIHKKSFK